MKLTGARLLLANPFIRVFMLIAIGAILACSPAPVEIVENSEEVAPVPATTPQIPESLAELIGSVDYSGRILDPPRVLPTFSLIDQNGNEFESSNLQGKSALISFAYTSCPDVCPMLFGQYILVQEKLGERIGNDVDLIIITVDPERDTPSRLAQRTEAMGGKWRFLSGERQTLERVWREFRVRVEPEGDFVGHTGVTYLLRPDGSMPVSFPAFATADHFLQDLDSEVSTSARSQAPGIDTELSISEPQFVDAWVRPEIDPTSVYLTIQNGGDTAVKFVSASADWAETVTIHQSVERDGLIKMEHLNELVVPSGSSVKLAPGGIHLMARELTRNLIGGDTVNVELFTDSGGTFEFTATVRD